MKMDAYLVPSEELRIPVPPPATRRPRDWSAPVLVAAALLAAGTAVASRPAPPTHMLARS